MSPGERLDPEVAQEIRDTIRIGPRQTPLQDAEFVLNQLVEIAVRALSPGINDPFTALTCLDRLGEGLCHLAGRNIPSSFRRDPAGNIRVITHPVTFSTLADAAFGQIRHYGRDSVVILLRLSQVIATTLEHTRRGEDKAALLGHALRTKHAGEALSGEEDRQAIAESYRMILRAAGRGRLADFQEVSNFSSMSLGEPAPPEPK